MSEQPAKYGNPLDESEPDERIAVKIKLPIALAARLQRRAKQRGIEPEQLILEILDDRLR